MFWRFWRENFDNFEKEQLADFLEWVSGIALGKDVILVDFPGYRKFFYFEFPLRYGDKPKKLKDVSGNREPTFVVKKPGTERREGDWMKIFSSPEVEIFENKKRIAGAPPIRWRLEEEEKTTALKIARAALEKFFADGQRLPQNYFYDLPGRFRQKSDIDAALWVGGRMRGSSVVENHSLGEGIAAAALLAARDSRFKPLGAEELDDARIEITLISDLKVPLSENELRRNLMYPEKGYSLERGGGKGWFLPEAFNVRRFRNLEEFLGDLAEEKTGIGRSDWRNSQIYIFEVDDFMESENRKSALSLRGPTVKQNFQLLISPDGNVIENPRQSRDDFQTRLRAAADWLCRIQEKDGNIPPSINPLSGQAVKQIDWPRLAFTAWALAEFGKATRENKYLLAAEKSFEYLRDYLISDSRFSISNCELTLAYFGRLSLVLEKSKDASLAAEKVFERLDNLSFEPILFAQIAGFFKASPGGTREYSQALENICVMLRGAFEENRRENAVMSLAAWAELAVLFSDIDSSFAEQVIDWLKKRQLPSGAFPESTISNFVYTRGTGKIFEALALEPEQNKEAIERALGWLLPMQYDDENIFFVPEEIRPKILGAFRHDYFNQEVWIDAAGHILVGAARLAFYQ